MYRLSHFSMDTFSGRKELLMRIGINPTHPSKNCILIILNYGIKNDYSSKEIESPFYER